MFLAQALAVLLPFLAPSAAGMPVADHLVARQNVTGPANITVAQLLKIVPCSANCTDVPNRGACANASEGVPHINNAFIKYNISSLQERVVLIGLMAYASANFTINKDPEDPGRGTRNMQSFLDNYHYANSITELQTDLGLGMPVGFDDSNDTQILELPSDTKDSVLGLVLPDQYSFGSAAWSLTTQCSPAIRARLQNAQNNVERYGAWWNYVEFCVPGVLQASPIIDYFNHTYAVLAI